MRGGRERGEEESERRKKKVVGKKAERRRIRSYVLITSAGRLVI